MTARVLLSLFTLLGAEAAHAEWFLISRHGECAETATLSRKVENLQPFIGPHDFARQMHERGLAVETHTHQLQRLRAVEVRVPAKELAVMFVPKEACGEFLRR